VRKRNGKVVLSLLAVVGLLGSMGLMAAPNTARTPVDLPVIDPQPVAVLSIASVDELKADVAFVGAKADEAGEGVYRVATRRKPLFVKEQSGWAVLSEERPVLDVVPDDPGKVLAEVGREYDLAALLGESPGKDRVNLVAQPIPRGVKYRLEAESDLLTALGKLAAKRK